MRSKVRLVLFAVLAVALLLTSAVPAAAAAVEVLPKRLPMPVSMASAVYTGEVAYLFGGFTPGSLLDTIIEVDPATGEAMVTEWRLPGERKLTAAVWTGEAAYILGGVSYDGDPLPDVVRFVPGEGVELLRGVLPWGIRGVGAVWTGTEILAFGNCLSSSEGQYDVIRYDPAANETEVLEGVLPVPGAGSTVVWATGAAFMLGGRRNDTHLSDLIVRFEPGGDATVMAARLPSARFGSAAAWDGSRIYLAGGSDALVCEPTGGVPTEFLDELVVYDPAGDVLKAHWAWLPSARDVRAAVWAEGRMLAIGGEAKRGPLDEVVAFDPYAPFAEEQEEVSSAALIGVGMIGGVLLLAIVAWSMRRWKEPPTMSGGLFQG